MDNYAVRKKIIINYHFSIINLERSKIFKGFSIFPVTAAAAATAIPLKRVRAPGPCRPSKLRLEVDTQ